MDGERNTLTGETRVSRPLSGLIVTKYYEDQSKLDRRTTFQQTLLLVSSLQVIT